MREIKEKEDLTKAISLVGLWTSKSEVEDSLEALQSINKKKRSIEAPNKI